MILMTSVLTQIMWPQVNKSFGQATLPLYNERTYLVAESVATRIEGFEQQIREQALQLGQTVRDVYSDQNTVEGDGLYDKIPTWPYLVKRGRSNSCSSTVKEHDHFRALSLDSLWSTLLHYSSIYRIVMLLDEGVCVWSSDFENDNFLQEFESTTQHQSMFTHDTAEIKVIKFERSEKMFQIGAETLSVYVRVTPEVVICVQYISASVYGNMLPSTVPFLQLSEISQNSEAQNCVKFVKPTGNIFPLESCSKQLPPQAVVLNDNFV